MKKPFTHILLSTCLGLALLSTASAANAAKTDNPRNFKQEMRMLKPLDLSQEQRQDIRTIIKQTQQDNSVFKGEKKEIRVQMRELMEMPSWDPVAAEDIFRSQFELGQELALNQAQARNLIYNVLNEEQKSELAENMSKRANKRADKDSERKGKRKGRNKEPNLTRLTKALDLTDDQVAQLESIREDAKLQMQAYKGTNHAQKQAMRTLIQTDSFDEEAFKAQQASFMEQRIAMRLIQSKARYDSFALLNDEQKMKMKKIMKKMKERRS